MSKLFIPDKQYVWRNTGLKHTIVYTVAEVIRQDTPEQSAQVMLTWKGQSTPYKYTGRRSNFKRYRPEPPKTYNREQVLALLDNSPCVNALNSSGRTGWDFARIVLEMGLKD